MVTDRPLKTAPESERPLVSVITICRNSERTIAKAIESVAAQSYTPIEYIVIDGKSTDNTLEIIRGFGNVVNRLVSEKDGGISDAFNKGIALATGEYVQLLNSDDALESEKIERSVELLRTHPDAGYVFGDIIKVRTDGSTYVIKGRSDYPASLRWTMGAITHPTVLARKRLYTQYGGFDVRWRIAMDYDWLLRVHLGGEKGLYSDSVRVSMSEGGLSDANMIRSYREVHDISVEHGAPKLAADAYFAVRIVKHKIFVALGLRAKGGMN